MFDAVPNDSTGYVFAAYTVFLALILIYVGILGAKFQRINRELAELTEEVEAGRSGGLKAPPADAKAKTPGAAVDSGGSGV